MIDRVRTKKGAEAITSDQWHVVHARFTTGHGEAPFLRSVSSEHGDRADCIAAARDLRRALARDNASAPEEERDQIFVRRPGFRSLERAPRYKPMGK